MYYKLIIEDINREKIIFHSIQLFISEEKAIDKYILLCGEGHFNFWNTIYSVTYKVIQS